MTYQGERARPMPSEVGRYFEVSKARLGPDGHISDVLWREISASADRPVTAPVRATAADLVDAIHDGAQVAALFPASAAHRLERALVIVEHADGHECITFAGPPSAGRELADLARLDA